MRLQALLLSATLTACAAARSTVPAAASTTAHPEGLPFIEDDFPRALAEAKRRGLPLFVDTWAPW